VTEMSGSPLSLPCCPTPTDALHALTVPWHGQCTQRVPDPRSRPGKGPPGAGECDVPGVFVNDPSEVWRLPDLPVTKVRPPPVPVTPPSRRPHVLGSSWGSQPARTPMGSPGHLGPPPGPRAPAPDGRPGPGPRPGRPPTPHPPPSPPPQAPRIPPVLEPVPSSDEGLHPRDLRVLCRSAASRRFSSSCLGTTPPGTARGETASRRRSVGTSERVRILCHHSTRIARPPRTSPPCGGGCSWWRGSSSLAPWAC
jgi:hypothetical protein